MTSMIVNDTEGPQLLTEKSANVSVVTLNEANQVVSAAAAVVQDE